MFNIAMLKRVFAPSFQLHDIQQTGDYEVTTRWTMAMQFTLTRGTPISRFWDPKLVFTGTSVMGINPSNGNLPLLAPQPQVLMQYVNFLVRHSTRWQPQGFLEVLVKFSTPCQAQGTVNL